MMTDVLRGVSSDKIIRARLDKQSTFGIMKDARSAEIKYIIEKLEEQGYIISVNAKRPALRVTEMSYPVLRGKAKVKIKKSKLIKNYEEKPVLGGVDSELLNALKEVRTEFAKKRGVPAFVIFSDAALADMCRKMPTTNSEFLAVSGVGQNKLDKYGEAFMRVIDKFKTKKKGKLPFVITREQLEKFQFSDEPISVSVITFRINSLVTDANRKKLRSSEITDWLILVEMLALVEISGNRYKFPTKKGEALGLSVERREAESGELYDVVVYNRAAQEFIINNLAEKYGR